MPAADFIKEISAKKLKAMQDRLKKEKPNQKYTDPKNAAVFYTPLHAAVQAGDLSIVEALLTAAADVHAVDQDGCTPLHWVTNLDGPSGAAIAEALIKKKPTVDAVNKAKLTPLHQAAASGARTLLPVLLKAGAALQNTSPGYTPLHGAIRASQMEAIEALLSAGADLKAVDAEGRTALMYLVAEQRLAEAQQLLSKGDCGVDVQDSCGRTALMLLAALETPNEALAGALLAQGSAIDLHDTTDKDTALLIALRQRHVGLVKLLAAASTKIDHKNVQKESALSLALAANDDSLLEAVLAAGPDLGSDGPNMIKSAVEGKKDEIAAQLVKLLKPAQMGSSNLDFASLVAAGLPQAAVAHAQRLEGQLSGAGTGGGGVTHLHEVAQTGASYDVVLALVALGLGPNEVDDEGDTPLHVAARLGHVEVCRALVDGGSDPLKRNKKNRTPRSQLKIPDSTRDYLMDAEEAAKAAKAAKSSALWDDKMKATQTESAFGIRTV